MFTTITEARSAAKVWTVVPSRSAARLRGELPPPVSLEVQPTMACNLRCKWCSYWNRNHFENGKPDVMSSSILHDLASYCESHGVKSVYLSGGGEPCVYPAIDKAVTAFHEAGCEVAMITNGTLFVRRVLDVANLLSYVQVSMISPRQDVYLSSTGRDTHKQMAQLPSIVADRWGAESPTLGAMYVLSDWNYKLALDAISFAMDAGYDYCSFRQAIDFEERGVALSAAAKGWLREAASQLSPDKVKFTNLEAVVMGEMSELPASEICSSIDLGLYATVMADGGVYLCVPDVGKEELKIGDLRKAKFAEIWGSSRHLDVLAELHKRYRCAGCHPACRSHAYNRSIAAGHPNNAPSIHANFL